MNCLGPAYQGWQIKPRMKRIGQLSIGSAKEIHKPMHLAPLRGSRHSPSLLLPTNTINFRHTTYYVA